MAKRLNDLSKSLGLQAPNFEPLIFPDTFSITDEDLDNPHKKIDFPLLEYIYSISHLVAELDSELKSMASPASGPKNNE